MEPNLVSRALDLIGAVLCAWIIIMVLMTIGSKLPGQALGDIGFHNRSGNSFYWDVDGDGVYDLRITEVSGDMLLDVADGQVIRTDPGDDVNLDDWMLYVDASENEIGGSNIAYDSTSAGTTFSMERFDDEWASNNRAGRFVSFDLADDQDAPLTATGFQGLSGSAGHAGTMNNVDHLEYDREIIAVEGIAYYAPVGTIGAGDLDYGDSLAIASRAEVELDFTGLTGLPADLNADSYTYPSAIGFASDFEDYPTGSAYQYRIGGLFTTQPLSDFLGALAAGGSLSAGDYGIAVQDQFRWESVDGTEYLNITDAGVVTTTLAFPAGSSQIEVERDNASVSTVVDALDFSSEFGVAVDGGDPNEVNITIGSSIARDTEIVTDHGALTGLADDDHSQYALDTDLHSAVTLAGTPDYITLAGQVITRGKVDLTAAADVTGTLPDANVADNITLDNAQLVDLYDSTGSSRTIAYTGIFGTGSPGNIAIGDLDAITSGYHIDIEDGGDIRGDGELGHSGDEWDTVWANVIDDSDDTVAIAANLQVTGDVTAIRTQTINVAARDFNWSYANGSGSLSFAEGGGTNGSYAQWVGGNAFLASIPLDVNPGTVITGIAVEAFATGSGTANTFFGELYRNSDAESSGGNGRSTILTTGNVNAAFSPSTTYGTATGSHTVLNDNHYSLVIGGNGSNASGGSLRFLGAVITMTTEVL